MTPGNVSSARVFCKAGRENFWSTWQFISVDPLTAKYSFYTPYQFAGNKPIFAVDVDGREEDPYTIGHVESNNRAWESNVRKTDPKHAEERIYEANKNAFIFVGGALTAGSPTLAQAFLDGLRHFIDNSTKKEMKLSCEFNKALLVQYNASDHFYLRELFQKSALTGKISKYFLKIIQANRDYPTSLRQRLPGQRLRF